MKKIFKILLCCLLVLCSVFVFTGCNSSNPVADKNGNMLSYSPDDENLPEGYFILHDGKYYPVLSQEIQKEPTVYQWFTSYDNLIPEIKKGDSLVYVSSTVVPSEFTLSKMEDCGYTIGTKFLIKTPEDNSTISYTNTKPIISFSNDTQKDYCSLSPISGFVEKAIEGSSYEAVQITEINNKEFTTSMLSDEGFLKNLTKNGIYTLSFYTGTKYKNIDVKADTRLFIQSSTSIISSYTQAKSMHFILNLPSSTTNGYYNIEGAGLFKYSAASSDSTTLESDDIDLSETSPSTMPTDN